MVVTAIKTHKITSQEKDLQKILDQYLPSLKEKSVVAITSKIVSIIEGRIVPMGDVDKEELIEQESQYYLPPSENPYNVSLSIVNDTLSANAGIDESNGNGSYILWPEDVQETANKIRAYLRDVRSVRDVGVIVTDSRTTPLRWGVTAIAIAYSGFKPLKDYIDKPDIFGKPFKFEKMSIIDNLASAASLVMGEGSEQTPLAVITDIPHIAFQKENPSKEELASLRISIEEDLYAPLLKSVRWKKGKMI